MSDARTAQWLDELEINDLVMKPARGIDRCDEAQVASSDDKDWLGSA